MLRRGGNREAVTQARYSLDRNQMGEGWSAGPWAMRLSYLASQAVHQLAQHVAVSTLGTPDVGNDGFGGENVLGIEYQVVEEPILEGGQEDGLSSADAQLPPVRIEGQVTYLTNRSSD